MSLVASEWLTLVFAASFLVFGAFEAVRRRGSGQGAWAAAALVAVVLLVARLAPPIAREWFPHVFLAAAYWIPALLVRRAPDPRFTAWLARADGWLPSFRRTFPAWAMHAADVCYLLCYPLVPAGYAALVLRGNVQDRQRFWVAVLAAGFACYATLPWLVSLPPRRLAGTPAATRPVGRINVAVLTRVSHGLNTFPSGHVAVSTAVALALVPVPAAAGVSALIAVGVMVGAVIGRHHYVVDVLLGVALGGITAGLAFAVF